MLDAIIQCALFDIYILEGQLRNPHLFALDDVAIEDIYQTMEDIRTSVEKLKNGSYCTDDLEFIRYVYATITDTFLHGLNDINFKLQN